MSKKQLYYVIELFKGKAIWQFAVVNPSDKIVERYYVECYEEPNIVLDRANNRCDELNNPKRKRNAKPVKVADRV